MGLATLDPGIIFSDTNNVIPNVVWVSNERLAILLKNAGNLTAAPELIVKVLSSGTESQQAR